MGKHGKKSKRNKEKKKKYKSKKKDRSKSLTSSSASSTEDEWVEKQIESKLDSNSNTSEKRDEWMNATSLGFIYSNKDRRKELEERKQKERNSEQYDPKSSIRELNPYWKGGGDGLPSAQTNTKFMKPIGDDHARYSDKNKSRHHSSSWRKKSPSRENNDKNKKDYRLNEPCSSSEIIYKSDEVYLDQEENKAELENKETVSPDYMTDKQMNEIAAKIVKAEILGKTEVVAELKTKLERARELRNNSPDHNQEEQEILLTRTDSKGYSKPINASQQEAYGSKRKKQTVTTHDYGKRNKYYADDDKYSLKNMFENEKFNTVEQQNLEFMKTASKISKSDDMDELFMDNIRRKDSEEKLNDKERSKAISEHQKISRSLDNCQKCLQSSLMSKHLMVSLGETVYLSLPNYEPLTDGHCVLIPIRHVTCATQLDENEWTEILDFRKSLTKMFAAQKKCAVFFENAINLHSFPHMVIHCVPMPVEEGELAPIYFKKAIDECEKEWSTNKKLVNMAGKDVRRVVPKGLPYFCVSFDMNEGFAHVVEDQNQFPRFFAEEIIGGILDLHHSKWRKSASEKFDVQKSRVIEFSKNWINFDCTNK